MEYPELEKLVALFDRSTLTSFELERGKDRLILRREYGEVTAPAAARGAAASAAPVMTEAAPAPSDLLVVRAPIVGTVYHTREPGTPPLVKIGDSVKKGDVLCLIEAMKMFNEVEAPTDGVVTEIYIGHNTLAEYDAPLFGIAAP